MEQLLINIFCDADDICKAFEEYLQAHLLPSGAPAIPKCSCI